MSPTIASPVFQRDADLERALAARRALAVPVGHPLADLQSRRDGAVRVVRLVERRAEERHDGVRR
jgi:hypothetical protein